MKTKKLCAHCGLDLALSTRQRKRRFCSDECYHLWWNQARSHDLTRGEVNEKITGIPTPDIDLTDVQASWLAGLIDGEGTIGIWREVRKGNRSGYHYKAALEVANTNRPLLEAIAVLIPTGWVVKKNKRNNPTHKDLFKWVARRSAIKPILYCLKQYLIVKKAQAELAIEFCLAVEDAPVRAGRDHPLFEQMYQQCKILNQRGRRD